MPQPSPSLRPVHPWGPVVPASIQHSKSPTQEPRIGRQKLTASTRSDRHRNIEAVRRSRGEEVQVVPANTPYHRAYSKYVSTRPPPPIVTTHLSIENCASVTPLPAGPVQFSAPHPPVWQLPAASQPVRPQMRPPFAHAASSETDAVPLALKGKPPVADPSDAIAVG